MLKIGDFTNENLTSLTDLAVQIEAEKEVISTMIQSAKDANGHKPVSIEGDKTHQMFKESDLWMRLTGSQGMATASQGAIDTLEKLYPEIFERSREKDKLFNEYNKLVHVVFGLSTQPTNWGEIALFSKMVVRRELLNLGVVELNDIARVDNQLNNRLETKKEDGGEEEK